MEKTFNVRIDGKDLEITQDTCGIAMFRYAEEDIDYLDVWEVREDGQEDHTWVFRHRELCLWMGRVMVRDGDNKVIQMAEREHGSFYSQMGWNPQVIIEDMPRPGELELYAKSLTKDLDRAKGVPKSFLDNG